jgi:hypothetical protein
VAIGEVRRLIQRYRQPFINEATTEAGRDALGYYHERRDENRNVGLGPEHDWSSHAADAGGYLAKMVIQSNPQAVPTKIKAKPLKSFISLPVRPVKPRR